MMARQRIELAPAEAAELSRRARATTVPVRDRQRAFRQKNALILPRPRRPGQLK